MVLDIASYGSQSELAKMDIGCLLHTNTSQGKLVYTNLASSDLTGLKIVDVTQYLPLKW